MVKARAETQWLAQGRPQRPPDGPGREQAAGAGPREQCLAHGWLAVKLVIRPGLSGRGELANRRGL